MVPISELRKPGLGDDSEWSAQGASMKTWGQAHVRTRAQWCTRGRDRWIPRVHWPDSLDYLASSRPKRDPASKHSKDGPWGMTSKVDLWSTQVLQIPPPPHTHRVPRENRVISTQRVEALGCPVLTAPSQCGFTYCVTKVMAFPERPALAVRPTRWI